jgi:hypothetical protein
VGAEDTETSSADAEGTERRCSRDGWSLRRRSSVGGLAGVGVEVAETSSVDLHWPCVEEACVTDGASAKGQAADALPVPPLGRSRKAMRGWAGTATFGSLTPSPTRLVAQPTNTPPRPTATELHAIARCLRPEGTRTRRRHPSLSCGIPAALPSDDVVERREREVGGGGG